MTKHMMSTCNVHATWFPSILHVRCVHFIEFIYMVPNGIVLSIEIIKSNQLSIQICWCTYFELWFRSSGLALYDLRYIWSCQRNVWCRILGQTFVVCDTEGWHCGGSGTFPKMLNLETAIENKILLILNNENYSDTLSRIIR